MNGVRGIRLENKDLDAEFRQALALLATARNNDTKSVSLKFQGKGKRQVRVGYIRETPVWKTAYRMVLDGDSALLQGWAIVENTSENDWNEVELTLISGRPISFVMDLYQPMFVRRPLLQAQLPSGAAPRIHDRALLTRPPLAQRPFVTSVVPVVDDSRGFGGGGAFSSGGGFGGGNFGGAGTESAPLDPSQGVNVKAKAGDVGELFQYSIKELVTLKRRRSAMLPIVNQKVGSEKLSIYTRHSGLKNPYHSLRLKNTTKLHLMQGPITIFDDDTYAGDAQIGHVAPAGERLISYALDLETDIVQGTDKTVQSIDAIKLLRKGVIEVARLEQRISPYRVINSAAKTKTVLIEHPVSIDGSQLKKPAKPTESTRSYHRFAVVTKHQQSIDFEVIFESSNKTEALVAQLEDTEIVQMLELKQLAGDVKQLFREMLKARARVGRAKLQLEALEGQVRSIHAEQQRIRQNIDNLDRTSELYQRYVKKLNTQEDQLEQLKEKRVENMSSLLELENSLQELTGEAPKDDVFGDG
jgi:hypothetical protein